MRDYSYSESVLNAENMLDYTAYYGRHVDGKAVSALKASQDNLARSEIILAESTAQLHAAKLALSNMQIQNLMAKFTHYTASQLKEKAFRQILVGAVKMSDSSSPDSITRGALLFVPIWTVLPPNRMQSSVSSRGMHTVRTLRQRCAALDFLTA